MLAAMKSLEFFPNMDCESLLFWGPRSTTLAPSSLQSVSIGGQSQQKIGFLVLDPEPWSDRTQKGECVLPIDVDVPDIPTRRTLGCLGLPAVAFEADDPSDEVYDVTVCIDNAHACNIRRPPAGHPLSINADVAFTIYETGDICQLDVRCFAEFVMSLDDTPVALVPLARSSVVAGSTVDSPATRAALEWWEISEWFGFFAVGTSSLFGHSSKIAYMCGGCQ